MPDESTTVDLAALQRGTEAFDRSDFDAQTAIYALDAVLDVSSVGMGVFEGRDAIRGFYEDWRASYQDFEQVIEEVRDLGSDVGFGVVRAHGRLRGSASWLELRHANVAIWANGLVERHTFYTDIDEGRAIAERLAEERR